MQRFAVLLARVSVAAIMAATLCAAGLVLYARSQGLLIMSVQTGSMRPAMQPGDAVIVRQSPYSIRQATPGDIISYRSPRNVDIIITHRLVSTDLQRGTFVARGDASAQTDQPVPYDRAVGVVTRTIPWAGYGFDFIRQPLGLVAAVYAPSLALIGWELRRLMHAYARQRYVLHYY